MARLKVSIFGAGEIGTALAVTLAGSDAFDVQVVDRSSEALDHIRALNLPVRCVGLHGSDGLPNCLAGQDVAVAAVPEAAIGQIATAATEAGVHYLDFVDATPETREKLEPLAARRAVFTGCGVSPGLIGNVAWSLLDAFSPVTDLVIRVGAIPRYPTNRLGYGQIWNIDGLFDEYTRPSAAIRDGKPVTIAPLEGHGKLTIDGVTYEEFITAGGVDLSIFRDAAPRNVTFKTIRYPGHLEYMSFLLDDLGLRQRKDMLKSLLCNGLPVIEDDVLLLAVTARGLRGRQPTERTLCRRFVSGGAMASRFNALTSVATGYAATLLWMLALGEIEPSGLVAHHRIDADRLFSSPLLEPHLLG